MLVFTLVHVYGKPNHMFRAKGSHLSIRNEIVVELTELISPVQCIHPIILNCVYHLNEQVLLQLAGLFLRCTQWGKLNLIGQPDGYFPNPEPTVLKKAMISLFLPGHSGCGPLPSQYQVCTPFLQPLKAIQPSTPDTGEVLGKGCPGLWSWAFCSSSCL